MGKENGRLPLDEYNVIRAKVDNKQKLTVDELHAFSKDHLARNAAKTRICADYLPDKGKHSFARVAQCFFDERELEEFNPDPVSRAEYKKKNQAMADKISTPEGRADILKDTYNRLLDKPLNELGYDNFEDALFAGVNHPQDVMLAFDPSPVTTAIGDDSHLSEDTFALFDNFKTALQRYGTPTALMEGASTDLYLRHTELEGKPMDEYLKEIGDDVGAIIQEAAPKGDVAAIESVNTEMGYLSAMALCVPDAKKQVHFHDKLKEIGFTGNTLRDLMSVKLLDDQGKELKLEQAFIRLMNDNKPVKLEAKTPEELKNMYNAFRHPFQNETLNKSVTYPPLEKPKKPSFGDRFLAFFGNKGAKGRIKDYNKRLNEYNAETERRAKIDEQFEEKMKKGENTPPTMTDPDKIAKKQQPEAVKTNPEKEAVKSQVSKSCETLQNPESTLDEKVNAVKDIMASALIESGKYKESDRESLKNSLNGAEIEGFVNNKEAVADALTGFDPKKPGSALKAMDKIALKVSNKAPQKEAQENVRQRHVSVQKTNEKSL